jgi:hypothetical protein
MMALREIAKVHIAKCKEGDMRAIKELGDRLDGRPAQILDLSDPIATRRSQRSCMSLCM